MSKLVDFDPFSGVETYFHDDPDTGGFKLEYRHRDVEPQMDASQALKNDPQYTRDGMKREWLHYAHVPSAVLLKWMVEKKVDLKTLLKDTKLFFGLLNDRDNSKFKTTDLYHKPK